MLIGIGCRILVGQVKKNASLTFYQIIERYYFISYLQQCPSSAPMKSAISDW